MWQFWLVVAIVIGILVGFAKNKYPVEVLMSIVVATLLLFQILTPKEVVSVLSNTAPVVIICMSIIALSLEKAGFLEFLVNKFFDKFSSANHYFTLMFLMFIVSICSMFLNNLPIIIMFTPVAIMVAKRYNIASSKFLLPIGYATLLGGASTTIGTSTNLLANGVLEQNNLSVFGVFDYTLPAFFILIPSLIFLSFFAFKLVSDNKEITTGLVSNRKFVGEVSLPHNSLWVASKINNLNNHHLIIKKALRDGTELDSNDILQANDHLVIECSLQELMSLRRKNLITFFHGSNKIKTGVYEVIVGNGSRYCDRPMKDLDLNQRYSLSVLGIHRQSEIITDHFDDFQLKFGDVLVVEGDEHGTKRFIENGSLILLNQLQNHVFNKKNTIISLVTLFSVIILSLMGFMKIEGLAIIGVAFLFLCNSIKIEDAYRAINWPTIIAIFGMLTVGIAMEKVGFSKIVVGAVFDNANTRDPYMILIALYVITSIVTEFVSSQSLVVIMIPVALEIAKLLDINYEPFVVAIIFATNNSYMTPVGVNVNTFVYSAGNLKMRDFMYLGLPLTVLTGCLSCLMIFLFWSF